MNKPTFTEEKKWWARKYLVVGVDEVGRGAFAGPVVAGAVVLVGRVLPLRHLKGAWPKGGLRTLRNSASRHPTGPDDREIDWEKLGIDDSKRLRSARRERLAKIIKDWALSWGIGEVGVAYINKYGIAKAAAKAMRAALAQARDKLPSSGKVFVLVDAFHVKYVPGVGLKNQKGIIKGDQKSLSIAAASIIAKVHRDKLMRRLSKKHRVYGWGKNKGYGTADHREAIREHGLTRLHRKAFVDGMV